MPIPLRRFASCLLVLLLSAGLSPAAEIRFPELSAVQIEGWTPALTVASNTPARVALAVATTAPAVSVEAPAATPAILQEPQADAPKKLNILILKGDGAINNIKSRTARETIIEVRDENNKPVAGAAVFLQFPSSGASVTTSTGASSLSGQTNALGQFRVSGLKPNGQSGKFNIDVRARVGQAGAPQAVGQVVIAQSNAIAAGAAISGSTLGILAAAAAAAATIGVVVANNSGGGTAARPTVGLNPGNPSAGPPR
jgi:hypothetical protein